MQTIGMCAKRSFFLHQSLQLSERAAQFSMRKRSKPGLTYYKIAFDADTPLGALRAFLKHEAELCACPVRWPEITVVHLQSDKRISELQSSEVLLIDSGEEKPRAQVPPELPQLAYLMLVKSDLEHVYCFGLLESARLREIIERDGYATYGSVNYFEWERPDSYNFPLTRGYYDEPESFDQSLDEQHLAVDVFFGRMARIRGKEIALPQEVEQMQLGFCWANVLASCNADLMQLLETAELELLWERLRQLTNQLDRARFAAGWFPELLRVLVPSEPRQALAHQLAPTSIYTQVFRFYRTHWKTEDPAVLYEGDAEYLAELQQPQCPLCSRWDCPRLPAADGRITFSHMELSQFLTNRFRKMLATNATWANSVMGTIFADQFWFTEAPLDALRPNYRRVGESTDLRERSLGNLGRVANTALERLSENEHWMVMTYAKPYIEDIRSCIDDLLPKSSSPQRRHIQVEMEGVTDAIPRTREELIRYAETWWPPCLVELVRGCRGTKHLKHPDRRKVSALLKLFGYSLDDSQHMFWLMFADTLEEGLSSKADFLDGKRGSIIANDFSSSKSTNLGVSCRTLINANRCPFAQSVDMEDMARRECSAHMNQLRVAEGKLSRELYPIASPRSFFIQRRKE